MEILPTTTGIVDLVDETMPKKSPPGDLCKRTEALASFSQVASSSPNTLYGITLTFNGSRPLRSVLQKDQHWYKHLTNINMANNDAIYNDVKKYILPYSKKNKCKLILFIEYTKSLDMHMHGILDADVDAAARFKKY